MVQKKSTAPSGRGRPRAYDPEAALQQATDRFWSSGYSSTSLDDIGAATGMNKPSLYAAFGGKRALYLKALGSYWQQVLAAIRAVLADDGLPLGEALMRVYEGQLSFYIPDGGPPRGCFAVGTATAEAVGDAEIRALLAHGLSALDIDLEARFRRARETGELKAEVDPAALAVLASAMLHTIAIRARAGVPRAELQEIARKAVAAICG